MDRLDTVFKVNFRITKIPWQKSILVLSRANSSVPPKNSKKAVFSYKKNINSLHRAFSVDLVSANVIFASDSCVFRVGKKKVSQKLFPYFFFKRSCLYAEHCL